MAELGYVVFCVSDRDKCRAFYRDVTMASPTTPLRPDGRFVDNPDYDWSENSDRRRRR